MSTKHLFSLPEGLVLKSLRGAAALNPALRLHEESRTVYHPASARVAVVAGGGAGHEPAHAGYTGKGMLAAAVCGDIFASPGAGHVLSALLLAAHAGREDAPRDVLVVINNYTGDRLNFGLAIEKARARGLRVDSVVVADDVSLLGSDSLVGPRGLAANILVCKILGAHAMTGASLQDVKALGDAVVANLGSVGVGLAHCHVPGRPLHDDELRDGWCEVGLGLHNEPGVKRAQLKDAGSLLKEMVERIMTSKDVGGHGGNTHERFWKTGEELVLFVNNLGGMSVLEMGAMVDEVLIHLREIGISPARVYAAPYMTSLNAPGFSVSLLNITRAERLVQADIKILDLLDMPTDAAAWAGVRTHWSADRENHAKDADRILSSLAPHTQKARITRHGPDWWRAADISPVSTTNAVRRACERVISVEPELTRFDAEVGDGDCGTTFSAGAKAVLGAIDDGRLKLGESHPSQTVQQIGDILEASMGGTAGALFSIFFAAWSAVLQQTPAPSVASSLDSALTALSSHTPARPGDRTLIDALTPFVSSLTAGTTLEDAVKSSSDGAKMTRGMKARLGRAAYVGNTGDSVLPPDPGAWGVAAIIQGFYDGLTERR